jgi:two-component system cell cycle response regulator
MTTPANSSPPGAVILIIEDDPEFQRFLRLTLELEGHQVITASDGEQGLQLAEGNFLDQVVVDQDLPDMNGAAVLARLREMPHLHHTRMLVLSGSVDREQMSGLLRDGAHDFVRKPVDPAELLARLDAGWRTKREMDALTSVALQCSLTGILNRRGGQQALVSTLAHSVRYHEPLAVLMMDVVDFKAINDRLGHAAGDQALQHVAATLTRVLRTGDLLARWGGDEFLAILPATALAGAESLAARFVAAVQDAPLILAGSETYVRISVGAADVIPDDRGSSGAELLEDLVARADSALYASRDPRS